MMRVMREQGYSSSDILGIDSKLPGSSKEYDLALINGGFVEFKSYKESYTLDDVKGIGSGSWKDFDQFLAYLSQQTVIDLEGKTLQYIFDKTKIPDADIVKKEFQKMMCANCEEGNLEAEKRLTKQGEQVFEILINRIELTNSTLDLSSPISPRVQFATKLYSQDSKIFSFIKTE